MGTGCSGIQNGRGNVTVAGGVTAGSAVLTGPNTGTGYGVYGTSSNNIGVFGYSPNSAGIYGNSSNSYGLQGNSVNNTGIFAQTSSSNTAFAAGVFNNLATGNAGNILLGQSNGATKFSVDASGNIVAGGVTATSFTGNGSGLTGIAA